MRAAVEWANAKSLEAKKPSAAKAAKKAAEYEKRQNDIAEENRKILAGEADHPMIDKGIDKERLEQAYIGKPPGERIPLSFTEEQWGRFKEQLAAVFEKHGITDATVQQVGSATTGWRGNPKKDHGPYNPDSDNDFAIFSAQAMQQAQANRTPLNKGIEQGGRFTVFKNKASDGRGFYRTPLGQDLEQLAGDWNEELYQGHRTGGLQPIPEGRRSKREEEGKVARRSRDGFDFKLNSTTEPFASKKAGGAITATGG